MASGCIPSPTIGLLVGRCDAVVAGNALHRLSGLSTVHRISVPRKGPATSRCYNKTHKHTLTLNSRNQTSKTTESSNTLGLSTRSKQYEQWSHKCLPGSIPRQRYGRRKCCTNTVGYVSAVAQIHAQFVAVLSEARRGLLPGRAPRPRRVTTCFSSSLVAIRRLFRCEQARSGEGSQKVQCRHKCSSKICLTN